MKYNYEIVDGIVPYAGVGLAYVKFFEDDTEDQIQYRDDFAAIVQAGVNVAINEKWVANADIKQSFVDTEAKIAGGRATADVDINSTFFGLGVGYKW